MKSVLSAVLVLLVLAGCSSVPRLYPEEVVGLGAGTAIGAYSGQQLFGTYGAAGGAVLGAAFGLYYGDAWADQDPDHFDPGLWP
ncbi:hypothetical protein JCM17960_20010 [Magnetospira thiophila]